MSRRVSSADRYELAINRREAAARELYEAEVALHAAHQTRVDAWVMAASDHLHRALISLGEAEADVETAAETRRADAEALQRQLCPVPVRRRR